MKLPSHVHLHLSKQQHNELDSVVDNGRHAMHLMTRTLLERASSSDDDSSPSSSTSCKPDDTRPVCQKPTGASQQTLPIVLGVVIPVVAALVACIILHRRYIKRQRAEDAADPHKSLDFGTGHGSSKGGKPVPEMTVTDLGGGSKRPRGMSMDMGSPYLLPGGLGNSRASIHSMSRSMDDQHDPYRQVAMIRNSNESSQPRIGDNGSVYSASTNHSGVEKANLLRNAQRMSRSNPFRTPDPMSPHSSQSSEELPLRPLHSSHGRSMPPSRKTSLGSEPILPDIQEHQPPQRKHSLPQSPDSPQPMSPPPLPEPAIEAVPPPRTSASSAPRPERKSSASAGARANVTSMASESSRYTNDHPAVPSIIMPSVPVVQEPEEDAPYDIDPAMISAGRLSLDAPLQNLDVAHPQGQRMSVMGLRPLPPDHPEENPETRANRIRSFYKEYFDDSRPPPPQATYADDYDASYMEGAIYDPETGGFVMAGRPFAQGPQRRAMTPPPGGASRRPMGPGPMGPHRRQMSTMSAGGAGFRGRGGPAPPMPKKPLPPPKPLVGLPTPAKLKDYDSVISTPIDFAPPSSFRTWQNGSRPSSPALGGAEFPYSPAVRPFSPLATSTDELQALPSPHMLRKSGTFTSLDFAPPTFPGQRGDSASDAGSIRSARSGISAVQNHAVRAGAYRVSRIPHNIVTTRDDVAAQLRPKMDLTTPA